LHADPLKAGLAQEVLEHWKLAGDSNCFKILKETNSSFEIVRDTDLASLGRLASLTIHAIVG
jgi:hypothetical protein